MENYRQGLLLINSRERYEQFLHSGFRVILRDEDRNVKETLRLAEESFGLWKPAETDREGKDEQAV
ncbi:MAG: hypothetical protein IKE16_09685 [Solobacterium sp.]|nr:hypothetical protein [Solobacterium sp.]MBR2794904.1 hypothetical protein [Solobacterium sp.]